MDARAVGVIRPKSGRKPDTITPNATRTANVWRTRIPKFVRFLLEAGSGGGARSFIPVSWFETTPQEGSPKSAESEIGKEGIDGDSGESVKFHLCGKDAVEGITMGAFNAGGANELIKSKR